MANELDIGLAVQSADQLANEIKSQLRNMCSVLTAWRNVVVAANATDSGHAQQVYQTVAATRQYVITNGGAPGVAAAFKAQNPNLPSDYDPVARYNIADVEIIAFLTWFQTNWPEKTAAGKPAYVQWHLNTGEHQTFTFPIAGAGQTDLVAKINAVLARFN